MISTHKIIKTKSSIPGIIWQVERGICSECGIKIVRFNFGTIDIGVWSYINNDNKRSLTIPTCTQYKMNNALG